MAPAPFYICFQEEFPAIVLQDNITGEYNKLVQEEVQK